MPNRGLVLAYHSANVTGTDYASNDHMALTADLRTIAASGWRLCPLSELVEQCLSVNAGNERLVAITCDDGISLDYHDFDHPAHGLQPSFRRILNDFADERPDLDLQLSCFVIASPDAREQLDRKDFLSLGLWPDQWWASANSIGMLQIENHSWDHNHPSVDPTAQRHQRKGRFEPIDDFEQCEAELAQAQDYIAAVSGRRPRYFAYPWGQSSEYLRTEYLPREASRLGLEAAFGCDLGLVTADSDRWMLPRAVCGEHWRSAAQLQRMFEQMNR